MRIASDDVIETGMNGRPLNIVTVDKGQKAAVLLPPKPGMPGHDVFGNDIPVKAVNPLTPKIGRNVVFDPNTGLFVATQPGRVVIDGDAVDIQNILVIGRDLAGSVGHIKFPGELVVRGWVQSGLLVEGGKDILIEGGVEAARVFSSAGSILVRKGILGGGSGFVWAKWDVTAGYIERATVLAGGALRTSSAVGCDLAAGETVRVTDGRGMVMGCKIYAGSGVEVKTIGAGKDGPTIVYLGRTPEELLELSRIKRRMDNLQKEVSTAETDLNNLLTSSDYADGGASPEKNEHVLRLAKKILILNTRVDDLKQRESRLDEAMALRVDGKLDVHGRVYPGVKVVIGGLLYPVKKTLSWVRFQYDVGQRRVVAIPLT